MYKRESIYSKLYVQYSKRAKFTPRVGRPHRPKVIAWHGPDAFFRNRFYELDNWYKARIQRPEILPKMHIIDPDLFMESYEQKMIHPKQRTSNIGFSKPKEREIRKTVEEKEEIEKKAIKNELLIDLSKPDSSNQLALTEHFNIFEDLFLPGSYFHNTQPVNICWESEPEKGSSSKFEFVHFGNIVKAENTQQEPIVRIGKVGESKAFNTLLMVNLEGPAHKEEATSQSSIKSPFDEMANAGAGKAGKQSANLGVADAEAEMLERIQRPQLLHWMVANIPDGEKGDAEIVVERGQLIIPYLQPVPFMGTGYHRFVFLLLRHRKPMDFSAYKIDESQNSISPLLRRAFSVNSFCKTHEEEMTPSALRFCQIKWDQSCDRALHKIGQKSPKYWYEWNAPLKPEQKEFPKKAMPFNHYLNLFRNPSTVRREVQKRRLEMLVKMKPEQEILMPQKYPDIFYTENRRALPEFEHQRLMAENVGEGVFSALYHPYENPAEQHQMPKWRIEEEIVEGMKQIEVA